MKMSNHLIRTAVASVAMTALALTGCNDDDNGTGGVSGEGSMVLVMHDAPVDDFKEAWVTVTSVTMISADDEGGSGEIVLSDAVRMDLLSLDSAALVLAMADIDAGAYSKIRLQVSDPEFVRDDDSVFTGDDVKLVANGHVDLNTQGDVFIAADDITVVSLDVDLDNSVQINQTGNGRYILRPQIFVDNSASGEEGIIINNATITTLDVNTGAFMITTDNHQSSADLRIVTTIETDIVAANGLPLLLSTISVGSSVDIVGTINMETGVVTASRVKMLL